MTFRAALEVPFWASLEPALEAQTLMKARGCVHHGLQDGSKSDTDIELIVDDHRL